MHKGGAGCGCCLMRPWKQSCLLVGYELGDTLAQVIFSPVPPFLPHEYPPLSRSKLGGDGNPHTHLGTRKLFSFFLSFFVGFPPPPPNISAF